MIVFLNGRFVPEEQAVVSIFDRGFLYGDGLFETLRVFNGKPFRWRQHLDRLRQGADFLCLGLPFEEEPLHQVALELIARNALPDGVLRLTLSRGIGPRGYSLKGAKQPTLVMTLHPAPKSDEAQSVGWKLITASVRLPAREPLVRFKTCNKLPQILARAEADAAGADDALLLNTDGYVVEASSSNLFWVEDGVVCTPPVAGGVLPGVTRAVTLEICRALTVPIQEAAPRPKELLRAQGVFLTLSTRGVVEAVTLDGHPLQRSSVVGTIQARYRQLLKTETAAGPATQ